jgi:hypothetical protein
MSASSQSNLNSNLKSKNKKEKENRKKEKKNLKPSWAEEKGFGPLSASAQAALSRRSQPLTFGAQLSAPLTPRGLVFGFTDTRVPPALFLSHDRNSPRRNRGR